jgi:hypothetical protein
MVAYATTEWQVTSASAPLAKLAYSATWCQFHKNFFGFVDEALYIYAVVSS